MVDCAHEVHPHLAEAANVHVMQGNATELNQLLEARGVTLSANPIVCILMNTYGILPEHVRALALEQMWHAIADGGTLVIGCWDKEKMRVGYADYYMKNPKLCGKCSEADFDFSKGEFYNKRNGNLVSERRLAAG